MEERENVVCVCVCVNGVRTDEERMRMQKVVAGTREGQGREDAYGRRKCGWGTRDDDEEEEQRGRGERTGKKRTRTERVRLRKEERGMNG